MKHNAYLCAVLACLPVMAHAQTAVDPAAPTPTVPYRSVFVDTPKGVETETVDWIAAHAQVAQFPRGHIDLLKWEAAQAKAKASAETPAAPATPDTRQP